MILRRIGVREIIMLKRNMIVIAVLGILIVSGGLLYYSIYQQRDITRLIIGEWEDNNGEKSIFNKDMTMVYMYSSNDMINGKYEFITDSVMVWTLQRVHAPNDKLIFKYTINNRNEITLEDMYYNRNNELVSYNNPKLTLSRIK
jgi:hypothetical protein